jgi:hypothetical protein
MSNPKTGKRKIFSELMEGLNVMKDHREGKVTLRTHKLPDTEIEESPGAEFFVAVRKEFMFRGPSGQTCCESALGP